MASVENNNKSGAIKIAGYLEKKRRKRVVAKWKKYWFVLEGRLLLYYKSHFEVSNLCPCRGSINMGVAISVRPLNTQTHSITGIYMFEIVTHTNKRVLLRTKDKTTQEQWLQALLDALGQPKLLSSSRVHHFRYSLDSLTPSEQAVSDNIQFRRQYTLPQNIKNIELHRRRTFFGRIKNLTGRHSRSLDAILKKSKETEFMSTIRDDSSESSNSINEKDLESESKITKYRSLESIPNKHQETKKSDQNENCIVCENDKCEYVTENNSITLTNNANENVTCAVIENENYACVIENSIKTPINNTNKNENSIDTENESYSYVTDINSILLINNSDEKSCKEHNLETENELYDENENEKTNDNINIKNTVYDTPTIDNDTNSQQSKEILDDDSNDIYEVCSEDSEINSKKSLALDIGNDIENKTDENTVEYYSSTYDSTMEDVYSDIDEKKLKPDLPSRNHNDTNQSNGDDYSLIEKKKRPFFIKFNLNKKKDNTNKISKSSPKTKTITVRKESFMDKLFKPHKKKASNNIDENYVDIETIKINDNDKEKNKTPVTVDPPKRIWGGHEVLSPTTMQELNEKLNHERKKVLSRCYDEFGYPDHEDIYEAIEDTRQKIDQPEEIPGLPPRKGSRQRSRSPWHDVPTNNSPFSKSNYNQSEDTQFTLNQSPPPGSSMNRLVNLYSAVQKYKKEEFKNGPIDTSELSVKQLIHKFDEPSHKDQMILKHTTTDEDVVLRKDQCDNCFLDDDGQNSEELNLLLNELSKITIAPLVQPRVINSLIQVQQNMENKDTQQSHHSCTSPISDEEWLALGPIRRRRYSEPDYDVPRSHRSLDFVPPLPPKTNSISETSATKFFDQSVCESSTPIIICDSIEPPSIPWSRSITPDSLEPNDNHILRKHEELDRSMGNETISKHSPLISIKENTLEFIENEKYDTINEKFFDSLENATSF